MSRVHLDHLVPAELLLVAKPLLLPQKMLQGGALLLESAELMRGDAQAISAHAFSRLARARAPARESGPLPLVP